MTIRARNNRTLVIVLASVVLVPLALTPSGCVSSRVLPRAQLHPGDSFTRSVVFLEGGTKYEFSRVAVVADSVIGEYQVNVARDEGTKAVYYEDVTRRHGMALAEVDSVAVLQRDSRKTLLYGAGAVGAGLLIYGMVNAGSPGSD